MADIQTLTTRILEAELALHKLATGSKAEMVQQGAANTNSMVKYTPAQVPALKAYIAELKAERGMLDGSGYGVRHAIHTT